MAARVDIDLALELGVGAAVVQATAKEWLAEGEHVVWEPTAGGQRRKAYTAAGLTLLRTLLGAPPVEKAAAPLLLMPPREEEPPNFAPERISDEKAAVSQSGAEKPASEPQAPAVTMLTILRIFPNPIWVLVLTPDKKTAEVRVRHSKLLVPGKGLRCTPKEGGGWECADPLLTTNPALR